MTKEVVLVIAPDGEARHLVDPVSERYGEAIGPKVSTHRSSHVETWSSLSSAARQWLFEHRSLMASAIDDHLFCLDTHEDLTNHFWADMLPSGGGVLGPFATYAQAINAEVLYLQQNDLPVKEFEDANTCTG